MDDPDRAARRLFADTVNGTMEHMQGLGFTLTSRTPRLQFLILKSRAKSGRSRWIGFVGFKSASLG